MVVKKDPCQTEFQFCRVPRMGGIKLQLLCGVRIELAVGSLPYPGKSGFPIVSPGRDRPLSGFPICKPCLDVRQNPSRDTHFPSYGRRPPNQTKPNNVRVHCKYFCCNRYNFLLYLIPSCTQDVLLTTNCCIQQIAVL